MEAAFAAAADKARPGRDRRCSRWLIAAGSAFVLLICGGAGGYLAAKWATALGNRAESVEDKWVSAEAGQLSLYDAASVASIEVNDASQSASSANLERSSTSICRRETWRSRD